jgi:hypothetical protein
MFRRHDATVALREADKTGIAETLVETFFGNPAAVHTLDVPQVLDTDMFAEVVIQGNSPATQLQAITHRTDRIGMHLLKVTLQLHRSPGQAENRFPQ